MMQVHKNRIFYLIGAVVLLTIALLLIFYPQKQKEERLFISNSEPLYQEVIASHLQSSDFTASPHESALYEFSLGDSASVYNIQAMPFLKHDPNYHFVPHITQTVVIAIDRDQTDVEINSFADLLHTKEHITFDLGDRFDPNDWGSPMAQHIVLSMSHAIYGYYNTQAVGEFMGYLWDVEDRFHYQDMWQPIVVTYDSTAAEYIDGGRNLEVIIPSDGTISLDYGILYYGNAPIFAPDLDKALIDIGYRLPDGRADPILYPGDYSNAHPPSNEEAYRNATAELGATIRRTAFGRDTHNFANIVEHTLAFLIFLFLLIMYLYSILRRVNDKHIARSLAVAIHMAIFFIVIGLIKYLVEDNPTIETLLWYCSYIAKYGMSASIIHLMVRAGRSTRPKNVERTEKWYKLYLTATIAILVLIFTNHIHEWVFIVTDYNHSYHDYNYGYIIVLGWMYFSILVTLISLIRQCIQSPRKQMFLCPVIMVFLMFAYSYAFIFSVDIVINFEISFAISIIGAFFVELCMISRIFPHNMGYRPLFLHSGLAMQIKDFDGNTAESSLLSQEMDENFVLRQWDIAGGSFLYFEDQTSLNNTNKKLSHLNEMRRENNRLLLQKSKLQADLSALSVQRQIYESIDKILLSGTEKIEALSATISESQDHKKTMATVNILACMMKRSCMFHINLLYQNKVQVSMISSALTELISYCKALDITLVVNCRISEQLLSSQLVSIYSLSTITLEQAISCQCSSVVIQLYEENGQITLSVFGDTPLFSKQTLEKVCANLHQDMSNLSVKQWEQTEVYMLTGNSEVSS